MSLKEQMKSLRAKARRAMSDGIEGNAETGFYWKPTEEGQTIEGRIVDMVDGTFGTQIEIDVERGGEIITVQLPAHKDIQNKTSDVFVDDYIWVTLDKIKKSDNPEYKDQYLYTVEYFPGDQIPE